MNPKEVKAMNAAFKTLKERQNNNKPQNFENSKKRLKVSRELCVVNSGILNKTVQNLEKNGIKVYLTKEKKEVYDIILKEIGNEKLVVKSKSNVTKELEITKVLENVGIEVIETDIGDRILQRLELTPSHPTGPITHISAKEITKKFLEKGINSGETPKEIVEFIKNDVTDKIKKANIGLTGGNALTTEEGSIILAHNEGNITEVRRKNKHIVITSIDKIYPNIEEALNMLKILTYNATGSTIPTFVEIISGVSKTADVEKKFFSGVHSPSQVIVIIIDNKRTEIAESGFKELLYCIGCGNCLIHCPMYNTMGNSYGKDIYLGGKGVAYCSIYNKKNEGLDMCLTCGKCKTNCPVEIDIPNIIRRLRGNDIPEEVYYFLKSHVYLIYYNIKLI